MKCVENRFVFEMTHYFHCFRAQNVWYFLNMAVIKMHLSKHHADQFVVSEKGLSGCIKNPLLRRTHPRKWTRACFRYVFIVIHDHISNDGRCFAQRKCLWNSKFSIGNRMFAKHAKWTWKVSITIRSGFIQVRTLQHSFVFLQVIKYWEGFLPEAKAIAWRKNHTTRRFARKEWKKQFQRKLVWGSLDTANAWHSIALMLKLKLRAEVQWSHLMLSAILVGNLGMQRKNKRKTDLENNSGCIFKNAAEGSATKMACSKWIGTCLWYWFTIRCAWNNFQGTCSLVLAIG